MKFLSSVLMLLAGVTQLSSGHYVFSKFLVDGTVSDDFEYIRKNSNGYMPTLASDILTNDFRCNQGSMDAAASTKVYTVAPGTEIGFQLAYGATMKHPGPLQIYMSKAPGDVTTYDGSGDWFKVYQEGVCSDISDGLEDTDWCTWGKDTVSFKMPNDMPKGQYLVRVEHIGLHRAFSGNAEFYFTCAQIEVTGSGDGSPVEVAEIPGIYQPDDPNIHFNIYYPTPTSYNLPGPSIWVEGNGDKAADPSASQLTTPETNAVELPAATSIAAQPLIQSTTSIVPTTFATACKPAASSEITASQSLSTGTIKKYYQCGGVNWNGASSCEEGTTCKQWNPWYHQCV
ncbi:glycosyl hydrolase family 61-domain-containing protein [Aspergillus ambiguus]|uniref:lignocellulolytic auxiliary activity family 9 protein n=1 Tax=Aspergillus ambiguus TaxID=176160 RepID=UPI003CCCCDF9